MTSQNETRNDPNSWNLRLLAVTLAAAVIVSSTGCLMPELVSSEEPRSVTEAVAKRDLGIDYLSSRRTAMAIRELKASMQFDPSDPQTHLCRQKRILCAPTDGHSGIQQVHTGVPLEESP